MPRFLVADGHIDCIQKHFDITDVTVDETDDVSGIVIMRLIDGTALDMGIMPGKWP